MSLMPAGSVPGVPRADDRRLRGTRQDGVQEACNVSYGRIRAHVPPSG